MKKWICCFVICFFIGIGSLLLLQQKKIDLVYTWVDGSDPVWQQKKEFWLKQEKDVISSSKSLARWQDNDELKYSLRSVEKFAPWIHHIYIVTDGQIPSWLNTKHPKITIVDHKDIMPPEILPMFNSTVIELYIPFISGLSEYFLYANDDMYFGDFVSPDFFFDNNGIPNVYVQKMSKEEMQKTHNLYERIIERMFDLFQTKGQVPFYFRPAHNIDAYRKSFFIENLNHLGILKKRHFRFRTEKDYLRVMIHLEDLYQKRINLYPLHTFLPTHSELKCKQEFFYTVNNTPAIIQKKPCLFCINDIPRKTTEQHQKIKDFLGKMFPEKSSFEM